MKGRLRIGEVNCLSAIPYYFPLHYTFKEDNWEFIPGSQEELDSMMDRGELDVTMASPLAVASSPQDFLIFPDLGYAARRHVKDILFFSDMLLDDMDEMTVSVQNGSVVAAAVMKLIMGRYLQYQNNFITGWDGADAHVLAGDAALRERILGRYAYVYDVGDLWRHYTGRPMVYYLWVVRKEALKDKQGMLVLFHRLLRQAIQVSSSDWNRLAGLLEGYDWIKKPMLNQLWNKVEYRLESAHFEGLLHFYEDCADAGLIEEAPELEYFEHD